ncbi:MAG: arginyltransferase [Gemmataceae bacterium]
MESLFHFVAPPSQCGYLPDETWQLEYEQFLTLSPAEYMERMYHGWRRFGSTLFRPQCASCNACRPLRIDVRRFRPNRSQRRAWNRNAADITLHIGKPSVSLAKLELYDRYHAFQTDFKGWPWHEPKDAAEYARSFVDNPFPTQEWCYYLDQQLIGVGYVDELPGGLSAIYFFYEPTERQRSLGTWNVLKLIERAAQCGLPHVYLGYYVVGCASMTYKANFVPNEILGPDGNWHAFRR